MLAKDREENVAAYESIEGKVLSFLKILSMQLDIDVAKLVKTFVDNFVCV